MKCLILGYGYMGKIRYHVLSQHPAVTELKVYDPGLAHIPENLASVFLDAKSPIPWEKFDAAFICTPNHVTAELCARAIERCKNVFCEKPPGRDWNDFMHIDEAARSHPDHTLMFGFNHRLHPSVQAAKALIGEGGLGDVLYVKGTYGKSGGMNYRESWRNKKEISGGGILLDQGIHMLDIFQTFLGPLQVMESILADAFWKCGVEDNAFVLMRSEKGIPAFLHSSATLWKHTFRFEIGCRDGYLEASGFLSKTGSYGREKLVIGRRQFENEVLALGNPREEIIHFDRDDSWDKEVQEFISAIQEKRPTLHGTLSEAREAMRIIRDVYRRNSPAQEVEKERVS